MIRKSKDFFAFIFLTLIVLGTYFQLILKDTILGYDDNLLLGSLKNVQSLPDYFQKINSGVILDIQPVRDLSYWIDFKLFNLFQGHYSFHLSNVFILLGCCWLFFQILRYFDIPDALSFFIVLFFALNPNTSGAAAWIAARKHLLSAFFIFWATLYYLRHQNSFDLKKISHLALLYSLSVLSQPISLLWVIWAIGWHLIKKNQNLFTLTIPLLSLFSLFLGLNFWYYKVIYAQKVTLFSKFSSLTNYDLGNPLLALGRYFYQVVVPFGALPTSHYPGSIENIIGLFFLAIFPLLIFKIHKDKTRALWILFFLLPLSIVTLNMTNIFCSDTYLLGGSIGFYIAFALLIKDIPQSKILAYAFGIYALFIASFNFNYVQIFQNENQLWAYSFEKEPTPQTAGVVSSNFIREGRFYESFKIIEQVQTLWPNHPYLSQMIAENIFFNTNLSNARKIEELEKITLKSPSKYFYQSILYGREGNNLKLSETIGSIVEDPALFNIEFRGSEEIVGAAVIYMCTYYNIKGCAEKWNTFVNAHVKQRWNQERFQSLLSDLNQSKKFELNIRI